MNTGRSKSTRNKTKTTDDDLSWSVLPRKYEDANVCTTHYIDACNMLYEYILILPNINYYNTGNIIIILIDRNLE